MPSWQSNRDSFEFKFSDEMPSFGGCGGPLRQKAPWDLALTCRTLTSYWVCSLVRSWRSKSQDRSKSSGGLIWLDPCGASRAEALPDGQRQSALNASPKAWDSPGLSSPAPLSLLWVSIPSVSPVSKLRGGGGRRDEGMIFEARRWAGEGEVDWGALMGGRRRRQQTHGPLILQLPTQAIILPAEGVQLERERNICRRKTKREKKHC